MEDRRIVTVKFGKPKIWYGDEDLKPKLIEAAKEDAIERLTSAYPYIEDINVETRITKDDYHDRWNIQASASGALVRTNKKLRKLLIKDIKDTKFYKYIMEAIKEDKVVDYKLSFMHKYEDDIYVAITGKGDIDWERIQTSLNDYNTKEYELWKHNHKYQAFYVVLESLYQDTFILDGEWNGLINLSDGDWVALEANYSGWDDSTFIGVNRHSKPKQTVTEEYNFTVSRAKESDGN